MTYTPAEPGLWGPTYSVLLTEGASETIGVVREPNLVFERSFIVCVANPDSYGGVLRQEAGKADVYMWKTAASPAGATWMDLVFALTQDQGIRMFCQLGAMIFAWRERYRINT